MLSVDSKLFKQVAEKFANEIIEKYCPDTKVKHSFALEALSHAFGYKDYNTIKPKLGQHDTHISAHASLVEAKDFNEEDYTDVERLVFPVEALSNIAQRQLIEELFLQLVYFYKNLENHHEQQYYYSFDLSEYPDYVNVVYAVSVCLGAKFEYFLQGTKVYVYWKPQELAFRVGDIVQNLKKDTCMQIYNDGARASQCYIKSFSNNKITFNFFHSGDGHLTEEENSFKEGEKLFLTYNNDLEMRMASTLVNDITNKDFDYAIFQSTYEGMVRAKYVVENHPNVAMYVLEKMYGYNPEFI